MSTPASRRTESRSCLTEALEGRWLLSAVLNSVGSQPSGPLTGKIVYASAGHGLTANASGVWSTGRGLTNGMVEDLGTQDQLTFYADELWRAGATIVPMRPIGHQLNEVVVDNINATYTGTWSDSTSSPYYSTSNGSGVPYRYASASPTETAVAKYTPNIPQTGYYPVYAWANSGTDRETDQLYRVNHAGGSTEVKVNHQLVGKGWVYLGTYYFRAGQAGSVEVSNKSNSTGKVAIADAIRFGNGMGDVVANGFSSGSAREDEAALYWVTMSAGWTAPGVRVSYTNYRSSAPSPSTLESDANVGAPIRWAKYMNNAPLGQSLYISFHSNASGGTGTQSARGGEGLYNDTSLFPGTATPHQLALATLVGEELRTTMTTLASPPSEYSWYNNVGQTTYARTDYAFGEIRGDTSSNEFDATILEVAFHDNAQDAALMRDPVIRQRIAQSTLRATVKYFAMFGGGTTAFLPEKPTNLRTSVDRDGNVILNWNASAASVFGDAPTGYKVYASRDGYSFDAGQAVTGTTLTIPKSAVGSGTVYFKVVATNAGGESPATAVAATRIGDSHMGRVLIVDGFDRLGRAQDPSQSIAIGGVNSTGNKTAPVAVDRVRPRDSNSFDYAVQHAQAIANDPNNIGVDTVDNLAVINGNVNLSAYKAVIWISGEESTADHTFSSVEQSKVTAYLNGGGKLFVSGAEIGWDLIASGNGPTFFNSTLHSGYAEDDANTYAANGVAGSIFGNVSLSFDDGTSGTYNVDYPDRLTASNGSTAILNYTGGTGGVAATSWKGTNGAATIVMGFPFETITNSATRAAMMRAVLSSFGLDTPLTPVVKSAPASLNTSLLAAKSVAPTPLTLKRDNVDSVLA